jgi:hypothetical protein
MEMEAVGREYSRRNGVWIFVRGLLLLLLRMSLGRYDVVVGRIEVERGAEIEKGWARHVDDSVARRRVCGVWILDETINIMT